MEEDREEEEQEEEREEEKDRRQGDRGGLFTIEELLRFLDFPPDVSCTAFYVRLSSTVLAA